jgi:hypothetical protein
VRTRTRNGNLSTVRSALLGLFQTKVISAQDFDTVAENYAGARSTVVADQAQVRCEGGIAPGFSPSPTTPSRRTKDFALLAQP